MSINVRWGVNSGLYKEGGWTPLWKRDSHKLERMYANNDINSQVCIRNTHAMASISTREVTENYNDDAPVRQLVRGTWFWRFGGSKPDSKLVAFHEDVATHIEEWYQQIKEDIIKECLADDDGDTDSLTGSGSSLSAATNNQNKPWILPVGELMGAGGGQYRVSLLLLYHCFFYYALCLFCLLVACCHQKQHPHFSH
jgi:hypothetical protein